MGAHATLEALSEGLVSAEQPRKVTSQAETSERRNSDTPLGYSG
jgi:hypothetical protein